ncbi:MAG: type II toxin-antitoxin system HicB family antitoxin [Dehalococcoidia bacterium]|nr:type II toxin-antitoxin system HicB family antitoxin [Dehalococcoidia bacterium]MDW8119840.1 type II toxin-antitoxin system HicB family antitoxin [Chloroflexota bacterium]
MVKTITGVEEHPGGYVAYPIGLGGVVGQADSYEEALADVTSTLAFHVQTCGEEVLKGHEPLQEVFVAEGAVTM